MPRLVDCTQRLQQAEKEAPSYLAHLGGQVAMGLSWIPQEYPIETMVSIYIYIYLFILQLISANGQYIEEYTPP